MVIATVPEIKLIYIAGRKSRAKIGVGEQTQKKMSIDFFHLFRDNIRQLSRWQP